MFSLFYGLITVRNSSGEKVIFSQACVKNSVHGGGGLPLVFTPPTSGRHPLGRHTRPPPRDGHCSGRYEFYGNVFFFRIFLLLLHPAKCYSRPLTVADPEIPKPEEDNTNLDNEGATLLLRQYFILVPPGFTKVSKTDSNYSVIAPHYM